MLKFAENLLYDIRRLRQDTEQLIVSGSMKNMEQYNRMMGRLEGYQFMQDVIQERLGKSSTYDDE